MDQTAIDELAGVGQAVYAGWRETKKLYDGGADLAEALSGVQIFVTEMDVVDFPTIRKARDLRAIVTCRGTGGNVSVRITGRDYMAVTPSSVKYSEITPADICIIDFSGAVVEGSLAPSVEAGMHAAV
ncbi:MAG: class II aldolase/adducin family protein, partial [Smithellaceae bacterium]